MEMAKSLEERRKISCYMIEVKEDMFHSQKCLYTGNPLKEILTTSLFIEINWLD